MTTSHGQDDTQGGDILDLHGSGGVAKGKLMEW